jgi:hypothetical protein
VVFLGIVKRFAWARVCSICIFILYALFHFVNLQKALKTLAILPLFWSGFVVATMIWLIVKFSGQDVIAYFRRENTLNSSAAQLGAAQDRPPGGL